MDVAQKPDSNDKKEEVARKPDSKDKTEEVAQSKEERGESSKRKYDDCTYQERPSLNISQASQMENAKKPKGYNIEEKPCVTTNPILPEIQETEKVAMKPHSKDEIESLESDDPLSEPIWWDTRFTHRRDIPWVCPWGGRCTNIDMSTYEEWPLYDCFDNLDEDDCLDDDLSGNDFGHLNKKDEEYEERWEKCFHVGKLPGEE